jgi:archaellum component FlaC
MDSFTTWLGKKATHFASLSENSRVQRDSIDMRYQEAMEEASGARGQQVTEQGLKQSAEDRLKAIKEDQTKEAAALAQLLSLQQSHSGVIGDDLTAVIQKMEAKIKTSKDDFEKAERDTAARTQCLEKLSKSIETADNNAARLKQESEHLSRDLDEMKKKVNLSSTANMFFKFGLDRTIEALEEDFGDMKDWIERKIAGEGRNV